jgi:c-di-GMP-binding flagellar brake protein YcgR
MENNMPLKIETLSNREEETYSIVSAVETEFILRGIAGSGNRAALYYNDANYSILTTVMGVDYSGFWLEQGPDSMNNRRITESDNLFFVGSHLGAKVQFAAGKAYSVEYEGYPAFYLFMPKKIYRLQRREYFRLNPPPSEPLHCVIPVSHDKPKAGGKSKEAQLHPVTITDISAGGVKLTCSVGDIELEPDQTYENCQIDLPDVGTINVAITVRTLSTLTTKSKQTIARAGCEFTKLDGASGILLQRYVNNLQRAAKAKDE